MPPPSARRQWVLAKTPDTGLSGTLQKHLGCSPLVAEMLVRRGITSPEAAEKFLTPSLAQFHDPMSLAGMPRAVERLARAIHSKELITIFGDYDVDGVSSTALLVNFLRAVGAEVSYYIPHRLEEGYGLSMEGIREALTGRTRVIVTVDNGVAHPDEVAFAQQGGIDVIVTDHHRIPEGGNPAYAIVNPHQEGCAYPYKILAGAGIALNVALALRAYLREKGHFGPACPEPNMRDFLDLASLGTIADIVPLEDVNRIIAHFGVEQLRRTRWAGLQALSDLVGKDPAAFEAEDVAFQIAPRINAGGRLADASRAVELLTTSDRGRARVIAAELDAHNQQRREMEAVMAAEAIARIERDSGLLSRRTIVVWDEGWHPGVIGIVASRLVERFHRPAIVAGIIGGEAKGSARSVPGYNIYEGIKSASVHLDQFGGHAQAAGFSADPGKLQAFADAFEENAREWLRDSGEPPALEVEADIEASALTHEIASEVARLAPFGMGNPRPLLQVRGARLAGARLLKEQHLKARILTGDGEMDLIGFRMADRLPKDFFSAAAQTCDLAGTLEWNYWRGERRLQFVLRDLRLPG